MLLCDADCATFADDNNLYLTGVLHLVFDALRDVVRKHGGLSFVDNVRLNHDADFATGLDGVRTLDALVGVGNFLKFLKTLDVGVQRFLAGTGARSGNGVSGLHKHIEYAVWLYVIMVRFDGVHDGRLFAETTCKISADDGMTALDLVVNCFAKVMQ